MDGTEIKFTRLADGKISVEMSGEIADISVMICEAMVGSPEIATIVHASLPTFIDAKKLDRAKWCEQIMNAHGLNGNASSPQ